MRQIAAPSWHAILGRVVGLSGVLMLGGFLVLVTTHVDWRSAALLVVVVAFQGIAGARVWRHLKPTASPMSMIGLGIAIGTVLAVLAGLGVQLLGLGRWGWAVPSCVAIGLILIRLRRRPVGSSRGASVDDGPAWTAVFIGLTLGLATLLYNVRNYPLAWQGAWSGYHPDMPFFEAIATGLARLGPLDSVFLPGAQVRYHWLVYAWAGQVSEASHAQPFVALTRVVPLVATVAGTLIVAAWARQLSKVAWVPSLATVLLLVGGFLGAVFGGVLNIDSPSQSLGVVWLLAFSVLFLHALSVRITPTACALLALLGFALIGGKVSAAAPALVGVWVVSAGGLLRHATWRRSAIVGAACASVGGVLAFVLLLSGGNEGGGLTAVSLVDRIASQQGLNPVDGMRGVVLGTLIMLIAIVARWAGLAWLVVDREHRWRPETLYGLGLAAVSLGAVALLNSFNEIWFATAAAAPLSVMSAAGAGLASEYVSARSRTPARLLPLAIGSAALVFVVVWLLWATGASGGNVFTPTWRWAGPVVGVVLSMAAGSVAALVLTRRWAVPAVAACTVIVLVLATAPGRVLGVGTGQIGTLDNGIRNEWFSVGEGPYLRNRDTSVVTDWFDDQMATARWLRTAAKDSDLLATNVTFGPFVAGITGMQTFVSGLQYQAPYGRMADVPRLVERENAAWAFIDHPSLQTVAPLCRAEVDWVWIDPSLTTMRAWSPFGTIVRQGDHVTLVRLDSEMCP